ncbi:MAG: YicC family protein [Halioglobus sp.]|nr:YicC family protein [Halioglobus sp.]
MIQSMTAFARESESTRQGTLTLELRTVNHRYLDASFKLPEALRPLEPAFREAASGKLARGKFECMGRIQFQDGESGQLEVDEDKLATVLEAARSVQAQLGDAGPINPLEVLQFPGVARGPQLSEEDLQAAALKLFKKALATLAENREREGEKLAALIRERLEQVAAEVERVRKIIPELLQQQRDRLEARIAELQVEVEEGRLEQEIVYLAQKADVDEELDRLDAHVGEVRRTLKKGGPCGRRLDFLMQELNREANTLSSKSISAATTQNAVELKVLIEQMREQVQNIE